VAVPTHTSQEDHDGDCHHVSSDSDNEDQHHLWPPRSVPILPNMESSTVSLSHHDRRGLLDTVVARMGRLEEKLARPVTEERDGERRRLLKSLTVVAEALKKLED